MEVVLKLPLQRVYFFLVLPFLIKQVISKPLLLLSQLADLEVSLLAEPHQLHVQVTDLVLFLLAVLSKLPDFELILLVVAKMMAFQILDFKMVLVFEFAELHVLHVLDVSCLLLELLNFIDKFAIFKI